MCHPWLPDRKFECMLREYKRRKNYRDRKRERKRDRSTVICNVTDMTRREQLDVAGCSCRRDCVIIVTLQPWSLSLSLGGVSSPTSPLPPLSLWTECLATTSASRSLRNSCRLSYSVTMTGVVSSDTVCILHLHRDNFRVFLRSAKGVTTFYDHACTRERKVPRLFLQTSPIV